MRAFGGGSVCVCVVGGSGLGVSRIFFSIGTHGGVNNTGGGEGTGDRNLHAHERGREDLERKALILTVAESRYAIIRACAAIINKSTVFSLE